MDTIVLPELLAGFYAILVLACGGALGFIAGRNARGGRPRPQPPGELGRRIGLLEQELELAQRELAELTAASEFMRRLGREGERAVVPERDARSVA
jgi:hypothetical protein